jgi:hypothetical protein
MQTSSVRLNLAPGTTAHQLMAQGMPESSAYRVLKQGWHCPGYNQRDYLQHDGAGGFAILETPEGSVIKIVIKSIEFISFYGLWYDAPLASRYSDRRYHPWPVYGLPMCSLARRSFWISPA